MKKATQSFVLALAVLALAPPADAAGCGVIYRLWQDGNNTHYNFGEVIHLEVGEKADLYIHCESRSPGHPYSTHAEIGAPADFGVGRHRRKDVERVLRLGHSDPRRGKQSFEAIAPGGTALGYRITQVFEPGKLEDIPAECRTGEVRFLVEQPQTSLVEPPPASASAGEAAHQLIRELYVGMLRRTDANIGDYPNEWFDRVQAGGLQGLVFVAETIASSSEFRDASLSRTRQALAASGVSTATLGQAVLEDQLLTDICDSLYGGAVPDIGNRRLLANTLTDCLAGRGGSAACQRFGRTLVNQRQYREANRELLRHWQRY